MKPGTDINTRHIDQISAFLKTMAEVYSASHYSDIKGDIKIITLIFPKNEWRGLEIVIKYPTNSMFPDLDLTFKSAVSDPTILCTKDESVAKMFITSVLQMYEPREERF